MMDSHVTLFHRRTAIGMVFAVTAVLWGCQTAPGASAVPKAKTLSAAQVTALRAMGFVEEEQGWTFNISDSKLLFESGQDVLSTTGRRIVSDLARGLMQNGLDRIHVEGHTDNVGGQEFNKALSSRRAQHVAGQFELSGFSDRHISRASFGMDKPIADNATAEGRAQNRRVSLIVVVE